MEEGEVISAYSAKGAFVVFHEALAVNLIPDFISLVETGIILKHATKKDARLGLLLALDLILTTLVWMTTHGIAFVFANVTAGLPWWGFWMQYSPASGSPDWIAYALTTYATSALWWLFLFAIFLFWWLKRTSGIVVKILESRIVANMPIALVVGIPCLICWPLLFLARTIGRLLS